MRDRRRRDPQVGRRLGRAIDSLVRWEYVRDPSREFLAQGWIREGFDADAELPADAAYTGWTNGNIEIWISPSSTGRSSSVADGRSNAGPGRPSDGV